MMIYIDTLTISKRMNVSINTLKLQGWKHVVHPQNPITTHYALELTAPDGVNCIYMKYFYHRYYRSLTIQFNIRKLLTGSNNNSNPVRITSNNDIYSILDAIIRPTTSTYLPIGVFSDFIVKRMDVAHNHVISKREASEYFRMLQFISSPLFHKYQYNNSTGYFNSSPIKFGNSGIVFKYYNKTEEMIGKGFSSSDAYDKVIEYHHHLLSQIVDDGYLIDRITTTKILIKVRFEISLKSAKITRSLFKHQLTNTFDNVLNESFQLQLLNEYIMALKLDAPFTIRTDTLNHIDRLYPNSAMNARMKNAVTLISNGNINTLKKKLNVKDPDVWIRKHSNILYDDANGCHMFYSRTSNLPAVVIPLATNPSTSSSGINLP